MENSENNFCRNCGQKLENGITVCPNCKTEVIDKRVVVDNRYLIYVGLSLALIIAGYFTNRYIFSVLGFITIVSGYVKYKRYLPIRILFWIEMIPIILFILLTLAFMVMCFGG